MVVDSRLYAALGDAKSAAQQAGKELPEEQRVQEQERAGRAVLKERLMGMGFTVQVRV